MDFRGTANDFANRFSTRTLVDYCQRRLPVFTAIIISIAMAGFSIPVAHADDDASFEAQLWNYLIGNNYKNWAPATDQTGGLFDGARHHGPYLKMYLNRTASGNEASLPEGSIVVMENYRADRSLKNVCVIYRTSGFNPSAQDWFWVAYNADGTVIEQRQHTSGKPVDEDSMYGEAMVSKIAGKPASCIACHQAAGGSDWVFFNDRNATHMLTAGQTAISDVAESTNR